MRFRNIESGDFEKYIEMATDFYASPAVLSPIPRENIQKTAELCIKGTPYAALYIFEEKNEVLGYGLLALTHSQEGGGLCCWLEEIYVVPEARGRGIGGEFIEFVKKSVPAVRFRLEVEPENSRVVSLYKQHGFYTLGYDAYVLDREL